MVSAPDIKVVLHLPSLLLVFFSKKDWGSKIVGFPPRQWAPAPPVPSRWRLGSGWRFDWRLLFFRGKDEETAACNSFELSSDAVVYSFWWGSGFAWENG